MSEETALKIACGLGGGMGRKQEVCGAVTGGILALGLRYGRGSQDDRSATELTYEKTRELMDRFAARHGGLICRELLGNCDTSTEAGRQIFKQNDLLNRVCRVCIQSAAELVENILALPE